MSTHCSIFYKNKEGKYQGIFCHFDGMPEHSANILYHHYQDETLVKQLIQLGGVLYLEDDIRNIVSLKLALKYKRFNSKEKKLGFNALTEYEKERHFFYRYAKMWHRFKTKWSFSSEKEMIEAYENFEETEYFLGSPYIYLYDANKKGKNKWEIFYHGKTKLLHRNITPSLIKKFEEE